MEPQKQTTPQTYEPVSCDFIDELEVFALKKEPVNLKVRADDGEVAWVKGKIQDIFTHEHAEFVKLDDGNEIRLDRILEYRHLH